MRRAPVCSRAPHRRHTKPSPDADLNSSRGERSVTDYRRCHDIPGVRRASIVQAPAIPMRRGVAGIDQAAGYGYADHDSKRYLPKSRRRTGVTRSCSCPVRVLPSTARAAHLPSADTTCQGTHAVSVAEIAHRSPRARRDWPARAKERTGPSPMPSAHCTDRPLCFRFPLLPQATVPARAPGARVRATRAARHQASDARD